MTVTVRHEDAVAIVTLDRPASRNAFTMAMRETITQAFSTLAQDDAVRAIVLTGANGHFCAGADTGEMGSNDVAAFLHRMRALHRMIRAITDVAKPVVAVVDGACVGAGWSLALACDIIVASSGARFSQLFGRIGFAPDAGAIWQLNRLVGPMQAKEIVFSGRTIDASEALELGLVLKMVENAAALPEALDLARGFTLGPPIAHAMSKQLFDATPLSFDQFLGRELTVQPMLSQTADHRDGLAAARAKQSPHFNGR